MSIFFKDLAIWLAVARRQGPVVALTAAVALGSAASPMRAAPGPAQASPQATAAEVCSPEWIAEGIRGGSAMLWDPVEPNVSALPGSRAALAAALASAHTPGDSDTDAEQSTRPNDPWFDTFQKPLKDVGALDAWQVSYGSGEVVVAVVGTGVYAAHPDLRAKLWRNEREVPANGRDDDGNGYVDDTGGWNFAENNNRPTDTDGGRGTMLAGIVAAETNNDEGIAGVSWGARIMPLKTMRLWRDPRRTEFRGWPDDISAAVCYAADNGAKVILLGGYIVESTVEFRAIQRMEQAIEHAYRNGAMVIAAAGDCGLKQAWCGGETNPDILPARLRRVMAVQSFKYGRLARPEASSGSWVDITAPGEEFTTTYYNSKYPDPIDLYLYLRQGTTAALRTSEFAAAHVAGVAAVVLTANPLFRPAQVEAALCKAADRDRGGPYEEPSAEWSRNDQWGCGILNYERTLEAMPWQVRVSPVQVLDLTDGRPPWPSRRIVNPYLNKDTWAVRSAVPWLQVGQVDQQLGEPSWSWIQTDVSALGAGRDGSLTAGSPYTATMEVCPLNPAQAAWPGEWGDGCQIIRYELRAASTLFKAFLPQLLRGL